MAGIFRLESNTLRIKRWVFSNARRDATRRIFSSPRCRFIGPSADGRTDPTAAGLTDQRNVKTRGLQVQVARMLSQSESFLPLASFVNSAASRGSPVATVRPLVVSICASIALDNVVFFDPNSIPRLDQTIRTAEHAPSKTEARRVDRIPIQCSNLLRTAQFAITEPRDTTLRSLINF